MSDVLLVPLPLAVFEALAKEDVARAEAELGRPIHPEFAERTEIWDFMVRLLTGHPEHAGWAMNAVVADDVIVGNAGFKGAPVDGAVELGYSTSPSFRRRGHALAATHQLLARTAKDPDVDRVVAMINADNTPSVAVVTSAGFVPDGDRIHPRFGLQLVFTIDVS